MRADQLTAKQEAFCKAIVAGKSQYDAYCSAYRTASMSRANIDVEASKLRAHPKITQRISALAAEVNREFTIETAELVREAARLAFSDIGGTIGLAEDGKPYTKLPHELDDATRRAVSSFEMDEFGRVKYRFWDKNSAQERLFKFKGMFEKDNKQKSDPLTALIDSLSGNVVRPVADASEDD